ncbi:hypothetical protein [Tenacibaculum discolor]|uniref:hypothetical protein n=1 Tax=Tenacibaculum discolor TaxID=361581 RepID=UPI000EAE6389|nr:hypothetical protein [Tenacibaculum discolor]RLK06733.1 hypothetical protein C8N27_0294 [Tenacibaculum discolor]
MKYLLMLFVFIISLGCKESVKKDKTIARDINLEDSSFQTSKVNKFKQIEKKKLLTKNDFSNVIGKLKNIKNTGSKYSDMLTNSSAGFVHDIFSLDEDELIVKTTSYTYKKDLVFYLHNIKCVNDSISIKPFLEKAQGKFTEGYLSNRVFILAMKDDMTANYIDIPEKMNPYKLRLELLDTLYKRIKSDAILCYRTKKCVYKDFREKK